MIHDFNWTLLHSTWRDHSRHAAWLCVALLITLFARVVSAAETPSLRSIAPQDAGLYVEVHQLAKRFEQFRGGELFKRWQRHPLAAIALLKGLPEPVRRLQTLEQSLGIAPGGLGLKLLGDEALLAVWPGEHSTAPGTGLLLVRTREHDLIARVVKRVTDDAARRDKHSVQSRTIAGQSFEIHTLREKHPMYVAIVRRGDGPSLGIMAGEEAELVSVAEGYLREDASSDNPSTKTPSTAQVTPSSAEDARPLLQITLQPRTWDKLIMSVPQPQDARAQRGQRLVQQTWQAMKQITIDLHVDENVQAHVSVKWDAAALPGEMRELVGALSGGPRLHQHVAEGALVAFGGRLDVSKVLQTLFASSGSDPSLAKPPGVDAALSLAILSGLGPDWGAYLLPARQDESRPTPWPVEWLVGVGTQPAQGQPKSSEQAGGPSLAAGLLPWIRQAALFAEQSERARNPNTVAKVVTVPAGDRVITEIHGLPKLGAGGVLAFAAADDVLWAGSSTAYVRDALNKPTDASFSDRFKNLVIEPSDEASHWLYIDLAGLGRLLGESTSHFERLAAARKVSREHVERDWRNLVRAIDVGDWFLVRGRVSTEGVHWSAYLQASAK